MTAELRAPLAIRITRPYLTEDEYLEHELETLTRASITLVGAQPRAEGVVLRFELVLTSGQVLLRGEGRVTGFKTNALHGQGGLALRFTRLDTRSKALVDRAAALRERRRPSFRAPGSDPPAAPSMAFPAAPASAPGAEPSSPPLPRPPEDGALAAMLELSLPPLPRSLAAAAPSEPSLPPPLPSMTAQPPAGAVAVRPSASGSGRPARATPLPIGSAGVSDPMAKPPPEREALLERLRARAKTLDPAMVRRLLASRGSS